MLVFLLSPLARLTLWRAERLKSRGYPEQADDLLGRGLARDPANVALATAYAISAQGAARFAEAFSRWSTLRGMRPDLALPLRGMASSAREQSKLAEARDLIAEARRRFPDDLEIMAEAARLALRFGDHDGALPLWQRLCASRDPQPDWLVMHVQTLLFLHQLDEATVALDAARRLQPDFRGVEALAGTIAAAKQDWDAAISIWETYRERHPDDQAGWEHLGRAIAQKQQEAVDADRPVQSAPVPVSRVVDPDTRALMLEFESLGRDCELGMVQRRYGAEPLGLLRWTGTTLDSLDRALSARLEGLGEPANTDLVDLGGFWSIVDKRWGLYTHTFVSTGEVAHDELYAKSLKRITYLRRRLLADLTSGEKIFVYKSDEVSAAALLDLHASLRSFGPVVLLLVRTADATSDFPHGRPGEIEVLGPDLFVGFLSTFGAAKGFWQIAFEEWVAICREARSNWRRRTPLAIADDSALEDAENS